METRKILLGFALAVAVLLAFTACQKLRRVAGDIESVTVGLDRVVTVYSLDGKVLGRWEGKIDISPAKCVADSGCVNRVLFQLPNGKRIAVYGATVIAEER